MGNPFTEDSTELIVLDTKEIMPECVVQAIKTAKQKGQSQHDQFVEERLVKCSKAIMIPSIATNFRCLERQKMQQATRREIKFQY